MADTEHTSYGLLLVRPVRGVSVELEYLMVRRRTTYAYSDLVLGRYSRRHMRAAQRHPDTWVAFLRAYLDMMTVEELQALRSMDFDRIWARIYSTVPDPACRLKFCADLLLNDTLAHAIDQVRPHNRYLWEPPKGRKHEWESDLDCARREFWEETQIAPTCYTLTGQCLARAWDSCGQRYRAVYYLAWTADPQVGGRLTVAQIQRIGEIDDMRWFRPRDVSDRWVANSERLSQLLGAASKQIRQWRRGCADTWAEHAKNGAVVIAPTPPPGSPAPPAQPDDPTPGDSGSLQLAVPTPIPIQCATTDSGGGGSGGGGCGAPTAEDFQAIRDLLSRFLTLSTR